MKNIFLLLLFISLVSIAAKGQNQRIIVEPDNLYSYLSFPAESIVKLKDTTYTEYGIKSKYRRYNITSKITVQTACYGSTRAEFDTALAIFEIALSKENNDFYHKAMIDSIYREWSSAKESLKDCFTNCGLRNYFLYSNGEYILYNYPDNNRKDSYISLFFSGVFMKITFNGKKPGDGWGGLSSFMNELCHFVNNDVIFKPYLQPIITPDDFLIFYKGGKFKQ